MVAHPEVDVRILALTCTVTVRAVVHWSQRPTMGCPADTGRKWLPAALCAQYVPKFCLLRCSVSALNTTAVSPSRCPYQYRGEQVGISYTVRARRSFPSVRGHACRFGRAVAGSARRRSVRLYPALEGTSDEQRRTRSRYARANTLT